MRKLLLSFFAGLLTLAVSAQTSTSDFESLPLAGTDTFYINTANPGSDMGFDNGMLHFPYYYDTSFGGYWNGGFAFSNMTDSVTGDYTNMYSAKPAMGALRSEKYLVYNGGFSGTAMLRASSGQRFQPQSVYLTNSTYAYNSMRDGDGFAKKFGGVTGKDSDWYRLSIFGWSNGSRVADSVNFYLADYRYADSTLDYIVRDWRLVNLAPLGLVDSISFELASSDTGSFGMNTPAYFCLDNFSISIPAAGVRTTQPLARVYPNPAVAELHVDLLDAGIREARVLDMSGRLLAQYRFDQAALTISTAGLQPGSYVLQLCGDAATTAIRFVKR